MPIDYSKWDKLELSDSDDDDNDDNGFNNSQSSMTPRVTRLDAPMKVTFGGNSSSSTTPTAHIEPSSSSLLPISSTQDQTKSTSSISSTKSINNNSIEFVKPTRNNSSDTSSPSSSSQHPSSWIERGGLVTTAGNGNDEGDDDQSKRKLYWTQDRYTVTLRLELKEVEGKVQSVDVAGILPYSDRFSAVGSTKPTLRCKGKTKTNDSLLLSSSSLLLLEGELPHPVHLAEDENDEDGAVDWSVVREDNSSTGIRFLMITLYKAVPMHGLSVWWRRPLMEFPELDLDQVKDKTTQTSGATASQEFRKTWEEAHKIFREEKKKKNAKLKPETTV